MAGNRKIIGIGMLGTGWMCRAHSNGYLTANYMFYDKSNWKAALIGICGSNFQKSCFAKEKYGYQYAAANYQELLDDPSITIFDNVAPDRLHLEPTLAAIRAGKQVVCEKPIAENSADAKRMLDAAEAQGVKHICGFSYRFLPAIRLAYELLREGKLGKVYHVSGKYYQDQGSFEDTPVEQIWYIMGTGVTQGIGTHMIDMIRFLLDTRVVAVSAVNATYNKQRNSKNGIVNVDATEGSFAIMELENGATANIQQLGVANGKQSEFSIEIYGSKGSLMWNMEDPNLLYYYDAEPKDARLKGFQKICVTEASHPFMDIWWPKGHVIGWEHGHVNMLAHFMDCVANDKPVAPLGGTFRDAYEVSCVIDAMNLSSMERRSVVVQYDK